MWKNSIFNKVWKNKEKLVFVSLSCVSISGLNMHLHLLLLLLGGQVSLFVQKKPEKKQQETEGRHNMSETPPDRGTFTSFMSHSWSFPQGFG